jgi:hypothetical protein
LKGAVANSTQKPLDLIVSFIEHWCPRGGSILDLCSGTGTALVAALQFGVSCVSVESSQEAVNLIEARFTEASERFSEDAQGNKIWTDKKTEVEKEPNDEIETTYEGKEASTDCKVCQKELLEKILKCSQCEANIHPDCAVFGRADSKKDSPFCSKECLDK